MKSNHKVFEYVIIEFAIIAFTHKYRTYMNVMLKKYHCFQLKLIFSYKNGPQHP